MQTRPHSHWKFNLALLTGALIALVLFVQCVRTYLYTDAVLVPQQAELEAQSQLGELTSAARLAGIINPNALGPVIKNALAAAPDRVLWMRLFDPRTNRILAQAGHPEGTVKVSRDWWNRVEKHLSLGSVVETQQGHAFVAQLPFRLQTPPHDLDVHNHSPHDRPIGLVFELAIPLRAVAPTFDQLRRNLIVGLIASLALLICVALIALRAPHYFRGQHLENELQLARRVQSELRPTSDCAAPSLEFAASSVAADHVGGDFYDVFDAGDGKIAIVLGDVSGKGVPAALLVSVLQGAIRSSAASDLELASGRINRMLCERTSRSRFATLFWAVFEPRTGTLRYVNAGHEAPILVHKAGHSIRLHEGGPVLGLLPDVQYSVGTVNLESADTLVLYSDGINEAMNQRDEEFGVDRILQILLENTDAAPSAICRRITESVSAFAGNAPPQDDCTLLVVQFPPFTAQTSRTEDLAAAA